MAAIVAAAGSGSRADLAEGPAKQFRELAGRPVLHWSVEVLARAGCTPIVVVVPRAELERARWLTSIDGTIVTEGGSSRQMSVALGLDQISTEKVLVHDAARPLVSDDLVSKVISALSETDAVVPGVPVAETLKTSDGRSITGTVDRSSLWTIQTPQGFTTDLLRKAHEEAADAGFVATDDAGLVERLGVTVTLVPGERTNIKLTYPDDFELARSVLAGRGA